MELQIIRFKRNHGATTLGTVDGNSDNNCVHNKSRIIEFFVVVRTHEFIELKKSISFGANKELNDIGAEINTNR